MGALHAQQTGSTLNHTRALLFLLGSQACFIVMDAAGKALASDMGVPLITLVRHVGHLLLMLALFGPRMGRRLVSSARPGLQVARGLVLGTFTLTHFTALSYLPMAETTAIMFISPFFIMLAAGPVLGERVTWVRWVGAAAGFVGMLFIVRPGSNLPPLGVAFALATMVCNIAFQLLTRKLAMTEDPNTSVFLTSLVALVVSCAMLPWQGASGGWPASISAWQMLLFALLGLAGLLSQMSLMRAYFWSSASFIAPLTFFYLCWAVLSGWAFFGQLPDTLALMGMGVILVSGIGAMLWDRRHTSDGRRPIGESGTNRR